jgi:hypothetical protein
MRYAVVIEKAGGNYSAYVPDIPASLRPATHVRRRSARSAWPCDFT